MCKHQKKVAPSFSHSPTFKVGGVQGPVIYTMSKAIVKTTFEASKTLQPIYTGGSTALDASGRILLSCVGEDANIVDLETGDQLASLEGVS
jgi:hypothetical protein